MLFCTDYSTDTTNKFILETWRYIYIFKYIFQKIICQIFQCWILLIFVFLCDQIFQLFHGFFWFFIIFFFLVRTYLFLIKINIFAKIIFTNKKHIWSLFPPEAIAGGLVVASPQHIHWWKVSISGVILVRIFQHSDWIRTRITPNTDTFYAVIARRILACAEF